MAVLVRDSVPRTLFRMAFPMLAGTFALNAYNLTDTWFVSRLGTLPLAAMGFSFPVVMITTCVAMGIGSGTTTLVAHAMGQGDHDRAARLATHGMLLAVLVTCTMSAAGYLLIDPIFTRLGATPEVLPMVGDYMRTWYLGALTMALPMMGNGILIAAGDSRAASGFMILGTLLNLVFDPILIFGAFGLPAMGIRGAALATVIAQLISTAWLLWLLTHKHHLLVWRVTWAECRASWRRITGFAVPSILSMLLMPISATVITKLLSQFGPPAVAATSAAGRVEMFAFVIPMALGMSLTPFVSQNFGANRLDRLREARIVSNRFALWYGAGVAVVFSVAAPWLAALFTSDPEVADILIAYVRIICIGNGLMEVHRYSGFFLTGMHRPMLATVLNAFRVLVLLIPLTWLGAHYGGIHGLFVGRLATDLVAGALGLLWVARILHHTPEAVPTAPPQTSQA